MHQGTPGGFKRGNIAASRRRVAVNQRSTECMLEGIRLAEERIEEAEVRIRLEREGKEADEINAILEQMDGMTGEQALTHFWQSLALMRTDSSMKVIADRVMPKPKYSPLNLGKAESAEAMAQKVVEMMTSGKLAPDHADVILRGLNAAAELKERELLITMAALQVKAIEVGLLDAGDD